MKRLKAAVKKDLLYIDEPHKMAGKNVDIVDFVDSINSPKSAVILYNGELEILPIHQLYNVKLTLNTKDLNVI